MNVRSLVASVAACMLLVPAVGEAQSRSPRPSPRAEGGLIEVEAVQYPAWLERGGHAVPLTPGTSLQAADTLRTGANARVQLKLAEGSTVKLGENARFTVERVENRGVFRSTLNVLLGAFRFTTGALGVGRKRDLDIRVKTITAGIRGTDLWGKSTDARDLVCLLEGRIRAKADGREAVTLDQPRDFYERARDGEPQLGRVDEKQVQEWSKETEIQAGAAAARQGGRWRVIASKFHGRNEALAFSRELRRRGFPAEVGEGEGGVHRVDIRGLAGEAEARSLMALVREVPGANIPSVAEDPARH